MTCSPFSRQKIISSEEELLKSVIEKLSRLGDDEIFIIAIDGKCASGKTTLSESLSLSLSDFCTKSGGNSDTVPVIHMDDFFLPKELRTPERLKSPGGNVHYERFSEEVYSPLKKMKTDGIFSEITYRRFSCSLMDYEKEPLFFPPSRIYIVEGAYSTRPEFCDIYDLTVFSDTEEDIQRKRIIKRNGERAYPVFKDRWIPMENFYLEFFGIKEKADMVYKAL